MQIPNWNLFSSQRWVSGHRITVNLNSGAGEAGAGFRVVGDEVGNIAMRAAEAAKYTANLIEGTVKKIKTDQNLSKR